MTQKATIISIVAVIYITCLLVDVYGLAPRFKTFIRFIELPCFIFLFYSFYQYRKQASKKQEPPSQLRTLHAKAFNSLARVFGVMAILNGVVFTIWGLWLVLDQKATLNINGVPSNDPWTKASVLIIGLVAVTIGVLVLKARPYRPRN